MSFIPRMMRATGGLGKAITGGIPGRMMIGAGLGGLTGAVGALNSNDPNQQLSGIAKGMAVGATLGAATRLITPAIRYGKEGAMTTGMPMGLKAAAGIMGTGAKVGLGVGKFAINNPRMTLGLAGAGAGMYAANNILGTTTSSLDYDLNDDMAPNNPMAEQTAMSQMNMGISPMGSMNTGTNIRAGRINNSTFGLVQGLNRSRH